MSTTVTYIHGIPKNEWKDRAAEVPKQKFINAGAMTDGELKLVLIREQLQILQAYYPEIKEYKYGEQLVVRILEEGLHDLSSLPSDAPKEIAKAVKAARRKKRPAIGAFTVERNSASLMGLIPQEDCTQYMREAIDPFDYTGQVTYEHTSESWACEQKNKEIRDLNLHLEPSAHHLLYEYVNRPLESPQTVVSKRVLHRNAIGTLSELMEFDRSNMSLWIRNGVMRNNAARNLQPFPPEETINILATEIPARARNTRTRGGGRDGLRGPFLAALPVILQAIGAAVGATAALVSLLKAAKAERLRNSAQGIGLPSFGPESEDWPIDYQGTGGSTPDSSTDDLLSENNVPLLLGGAAALLLLS